MSAPKTIEVLGQTLDVSFRPFGTHYHGWGLGATDTEEGDTLGAGALLLGDQLLLVGAGQGFHQERDTVLHELLHALMQLMGLETDEQADERLVAALSMGLLQTLRANPDLVSYLVQDQRWALDSRGITDGAWS